MSEKSNGVPPPSRAPVEGSCPSQTVFNLIQHFQRTRLVGCQRLAERQRVLRGMMRKFVNHAFHNKHIVRRAYTAPPERCNRRGFLPHKFNQMIRQVIRCLGRAFDRIRVQTALHPFRIPARRNSRPCCAMVPAADGTILRQASRNAVIIIWAELIMRHVLLPRPDQLDRIRHLFCKTGCLTNGIRIKPAPEPAANQMIMHRNCFRL